MVLKFSEAPENIDAHEGNLLENWNDGMSHLEYWHTGMMGISLIEVGGASGYGGFEAEGQEYFALCLSETILN